ncbi:YfbR-like 5'-deoxynucleotidase [Alicyclobacillus sp. SO9]|uniref:YfbR-like 5'-deoxynucleotidase n=1 Tax=Alicyclobacillus sp. SO9 TaxID=2665646 RepID=UPI0018E790E7|nr:YfbR-like 5'-deoxynucleotidase [Alicyclobacillus sp. SO9]QQE80642.1 HD domain-containing protein [Alicyclobacillus sp. SO9]
MGIHAFFKSLNELERIFRAPGKFKFEEHNISSHSFKVAQYAQFLGTVEESKGEKINWKSLYEKALNHDYAEVFIGDIKTPVKYASSELRTQLLEVEEAMTKKFIDKHIPDEFRALYREKLKEGKDNSVEGKILQVADKMDQVYEAYQELQRGNTESGFVTMYQEALSAIENVELHCVTYFMENILPDMLNEQHIFAVDLRRITHEVLRKEGK